MAKSSITSEVVQAGTAILQVLLQNFLKLMFG